MKKILVQFIIFFPIIKLTIQEIDEPKKPEIPEIKAIEKPSKDPKNVIDLSTSIDFNRKSQTIPLSYSNFDSIIENGNKNRWLIVFYAESTKFTKQYKSVLDKVIEEKNYKNINNIKFGSVDVDNNLRLQMRFNISHIPYVILVEHNKMLEISNFPYEQSIIKSIEKEDLSKNQYTLDFPGKQSFYKFIETLFRITLSFYVRQINPYLKKHNINYELTVLSLFIYLVLICSICVIIFYAIIIRCFCMETIPKKADKKEDSGTSNENLENKLNENNKEEIKNKDNPDNSEEMKKIKEEKKEEELKENINKEKEKNKEKLNKKEKKKKKE